ncbi:MFS transporter [Arthrobacter sp. AG1021]|nr:MFS transporter [Arthrobacter sp. AG1021]
MRSRDEESAGRSIGKLVGALTLGGALGAMFSGVLLSAFDDLTLVLLAPALFLVLCIPVVAWLVPESSTRTAGTIDWAGAVLLTEGLLSALLGISNAAIWGWDSAATWGTIIGGLVLLMLWVRVEGRVAYLLIDLKVLTGTGIGLPIVAAAFFGAQMFGSQTAGSLFIMTDPNTYGFGLGLGSSAVGLLFLVLALMTFIGTTQADRIGSKIGARAAIIAGSVLSAVSFGGMILMADNATAFMVSMAIGAFGNGLILGLLPAIVVRKSPADSVAIASALYNTTRTASGSVSGAVFALVMSSALVTVTVDGAPSTVSADSTYVAVWIICAVLSLGVALLALRFRDTSKPAGAPADSTPRSGRSDRRRVTHGTGHRFTHRPAPAAGRGNTQPNPAGPVRGPARRPGNRVHRAPLGGPRGRPAGTSRIQHPARWIRSGDQPARGIRQRFADRGHLR